MLLLIALLPGFACGTQDPDSVTLRVDREMLQEIEKAEIPIQSFGEPEGETQQITASPAILPLLSDVSHDQLGRCGGFFWEDGSPEAALLPSTWRQDPNLLMISEFVTLSALLPLVEETKIRKTITDLSAFHNRYYTAPSGTQSQEYLYAQWELLTQSRNDVQLSIVQHPGWPQPSVKLTFVGSSLPEEEVVIGGHGDSIVSSLFGTAKVEAPGADDNASGIAVMTEVIRILASQDHKPKRSITFLSYAAEEVGLRGSGAIAKQYAQERIQVVGVMQLDMVNFNPNVLDPTISLIDDYTDKAQTQFLEDLIDQYVKIKHQRDRCGYACSDHASWSKAGYPAVLPFEAKNKDRNRQIHSKKDTLAHSKGEARHAVHFAKIALAYAVELAN
jgi:leucyl aminopeptidase